MLLLAKARHMRKPFAILISLLIAATGASCAGGEHQSTRVTPKPPGYPTEYGPYNSDTDQDLLPLTSSSNGLIKEYHGNGPVLSLRMYDRRLPKPYYGQLARTNSNWNLVATPGKDLSGNDVGLVTFSLTTQTFWTTRGPDGYYQHRNGYFLRFQRRGTDLLKVNLDNFGGGGTDNCTATSNPWFPRFAIPLDVYNAMDSVLVRANSDAMWGC
jgi:hypothetical protein